MTIDEQIKSYRQANVCDRVEILPDENASKVLQTQVEGILLPSKDLIPPEFFSMNNPWREIVAKWFFGILDESKIKEKEGFPGMISLYHIKRIMGSYSPDHVHKISGCAYLMSLWFDLVEKKP